MSYFHALLSGSLFLGILRLRLVEFRPRNAGPPILLIPCCLGSSEQSKLVPDSKFKHLEAWCGLLGYLDFLYKGAFSPITHALNG